ncbi:MAG TPA: plastocyanin/azurin family copper-binding protein [Gemmatimonadales bacterium]|nr:plastocyanin/azurin family copper-binding protein [Gemmatimonadales bacterium]
MTRLGLASRLLAVSLAALVACGGDDDDGGGGPSPTVDVTIVPGAANRDEEAYSPNPFVVSLASGGTVDWINADDVVHTVSADDGSFESGPMSPAESFSFTFTAPGDYPYHCAIHPNMVGTITVTQ